MASREVTDEVARERSPGLVRRILAAARQTDRAAVRWAGPLRAALVTVAMAGAGLALGEPTDAILMGVGALFTGVCDQPGGLPARMRGMAFAIAGTSVAAGLGLAVCGDDALQLAVALPVALAGGYAGVFGPRAGAGGLGLLVCYAVFSGTPEPLDCVLPGMGLIALGGAAQLVVASTAFLTRRGGGLRQDVAVACRAVARALTGRDGGATGVGAVTKVVAARRALGESVAGGRTEAWFSDLIGSVDDARFAGIALEGAAGGRSPGEEALVDAVRAAAAALLAALALALEVPALRGRIARRLEALQRAVAAGGDGLGAADAELVAELGGHLEAAAGLVAGPWPLGRRAALRRLDSRPGRPDLQRVRHPPDPGHLFRQHAIRLAAVYVVAVALSQVDGFSHACWLPLSVAWIAKPDLAGSAERVASRVLGTSAGVLVIAAVTAVAGEGQPVLLVLIACGAFLTPAFLIPNYTIASTGATLAILGLLSLDDSPIDGLVLPRLVETVLAGVLVLIGASIWPTRLTTGIADQLAAVARALRAYAAAVLDGHDEPVAAARQGFLEARMRAAGVVRAVALEPGSHRIHHEHARLIEQRLTAAAALVATGEPRLHREGGTQELDAATLGRLDELADRLDALHRTGAAPASAGASGAGSRLGGLIEEAHRAVDECAGEPRRHAGARARAQVAAG